MMTTQARSLNQTQLIQHQRHLQGSSLNSANKTEDSPFDNLHQPQLKEATSDEMITEDDSETQKDMTADATDYDSQNNNDLQTTIHEISDHPNTNKDQLLNQSRQSTQSDENICAGCNKSIKDRYLLEALDKRWHEDCLKCAGCGCRLGELGSSLFINAGKILCKLDFLRIFGNEGCCASCKKIIPPYELVMRANKNAYHMDCFACQQCNYRFCVGDKFHLQDDHKIMCLICQCENESHRSSHTSGSTFSQTGTNFTSSQENTYEQYNQHFTSQNQQFNNIPQHFQYNNQQCLNRSKQSSDIQHVYQVSYSKSQSGAISLKTNAPTSSQPLRRLNDMLIVTNSNVHGNSGSMVSHNEPHFVQHQHHQGHGHQSIYRPQHQFTTMNQNYNMQSQQQNCIGMQMTFHNVPSINQHMQTRNTSLVSHNQSNHNAQIMSQQFKPQVTIHHQHNQGYSSEFSSHLSNMQQRNQPNQVPLQPQVGTIHHRNRDYDSQDHHHHHGEQQQTLSFMSFKDEPIKQQRKLFGIPSPANGNQTKKIKGQKDIDNIVGIATPVSLSSPTTSPGYTKNHDDGNKYQQCINKNEAESPRSFDGAESAIENVIEEELTTSQVKRNLRDKTIEREHDSLDKAKSDEVIGEQQSKLSSTYYKKRKTRDDILNHPRTIETLLQIDLCSDSSETNNIGDVDQLIEDPSNSCSNNPTNDNDTKDNTLDSHHHLSISEQQYMMSISGSTDFSTLDEDKASASESSNSIVTESLASTSKPSSTTKS